jgi:DNA-binding beta-propeller fold protein YncE
MGNLDRLTRMCAAMSALIALLSVGAVSAPYSGTFDIKYDFAVQGYSAGQQFSRPGGVFYDSIRDQVLVADTGNGQIVIFNNKGVPVTRIRHYYQDVLSADRKQLPGEPRSMVVLRSGDIVVADTLCDYLDVLDFRGRSVRTVRLGELLGMPNSRVKPQCLALDAAGNIYVAVAGDVNGIVVLTKDMALKAQIATITGSGSLQAITGLWVDKHNRVYATYIMGDCVRVFSPDGKPIVAFGRHDSGFENFSLPSGVITDAKGNIWAVDTVRHTVSVFRPDPKNPSARPANIDIMGGFGQSPLEFINPTAIAGDGARKMFVLERTGARLQAFTLAFRDDPVVAN